MKKLFFVLRIFKEFYDFQLIKTGTFKKVFRKFNILHYPLSRYKLIIQYKKCFLLSLLNFFIGSVPIRP